MKINLRSFRIKLWIYFVLFTALIFSLLWLLQTVFLQSFYNDMLIKNTKDTAAQIAESCQSESFIETIDDLSLNNSVLVYLTDTDGKIIYSSDQFNKLAKRDQDISFGNEGMPPENEQEENAENHGPRRRKEEDQFRKLPDDFESILTLLSSSGSGVYESTSDGMYSYCTYLDTGSGEKNVLYITTTLDAVGPAVEIIRIQLIWGTVISVLIASILAWFIAQGFAKPVAELTAKAEHIGSDDFPKDIKKGFCSELDELSDVLDETSDKLIRSRDFQRDLLANVSHDLRTPITMIKGYAEMVRDISRTDEEQCNADIDVIVRESDRLCAMVNEILEYSEMQSTDAKMTSEDVDISAVVKRVSENFKHIYSLDGGQIVTDIEPDMIILGDTGRLERAVFNLLDNAVRHNGENKLINVSLKKEDNNIVISITDHGNGIPEEELENIWDRYYTYRQRDKKGVSGLGLAIVKETVKMHGGTCNAVSKVGSGSTFMMILPCRERSDRDAEI